MMMRMPLLTIAVVALVATTNAADSSLIVNVTGGQVRGATLPADGAVFKGIPYAAPPVGQRRWREPMPVLRWTGVRDATEFGAMCAQTSVFIPGAAESSKEDCLFLNVWTPEWPAKSRKPVMVWIHGGGNFAGVGYDPGTDGEPLARRDVVFVSFNYRLGSFGFFAHPELTRESSHHSSGNQGLLDQVAALKWVRDNISRFGGDPNNVTVFGESAGSLDVSVLMTVPMARGLFRRVIGESGAVILVGDPLSLRDAERRGEMLASRWPVRPNASLAALRALSTHDILAAEPNYLMEVAPNLGITVDGHVLPRAPASVFAAGTEHSVPLMLGSNARERIPGTMPPANLSATIDEVYGSLGERAKRLYVGGPDPVYGTSADQWATDTSFRCATVAQLMWHATAGHPTFEFEFARVPPGREALGATHAAELSYVFGTFKRPGVIGMARATPDAIDAQVSDAIQQYWTNFAKHGDPNGGALPAWPRFNGASRRFLQFTQSGPIPKQALRQSFCDLFIENVKRLGSTRITPSS
jgi:para-nitrobenzyl esterase